MRKFCEALQMDIASQLIFVAGTLFLLSILATVITPRLGVPLLLVFMIVGLLAGEDGPGHIVFNDYRLANLACTAGLAVILFDGGMRTPLANFRVGLRPALSLATVGVLITSAVVGAFAAWLLKLPIAQGLLIGAILGSTDAAAVFSLLHTSAVHLNQRITSALEIESGINDPMAVLLTIGLITLLKHPQAFSASQALLLLVQQLGFGLLFGWGGGRALAGALRRLEISDSLYPLLALSGGWLIFGACSVLGGSGFLAIYLAGLLVGNRPIRAANGVRRFHDGIAWLAQIGMFLLLGLLATPTRVAPVALPALGIAAVLILVARPLAVAISLAPFRMPWREQAYIAWVGLRGSVPIVLATFPLIEGLPGATRYFDIAFFVVLVSMSIQGWTVAPVARLLGLQMPDTSTRVRRTEIDLPGSGGYEIVSYRVNAHSAYIGRKPKNLPIGDASRIVSLSRDGNLLPYREWGTLQAGDYISLLASHMELPLLDELFKSSAPQIDAEKQRYFGEFVIDPEATLKVLVDLYGVETGEAPQTLSLRQYFESVMHRPVVGDRLRLGALELVVRNMEGNHITGMGLRLPRE